MQLRTTIDRLIRNWPYKLICIALAVMIYGFHQYTTMGDKSLTLPLTVRGSDQLTVLSPLPEGIGVIVRGSLEGISLLGPSDLSAYIDLSGYTEPGEVSVPIQIELSAQAQVIEPLEITVPFKNNPLRLKLDRKISRVVPVKPVLVGTPASGYEVREVSVIPTQVRVNGPETVLNALESIETESIALDGKSGRFSLKTRLMPAGQSLSVEGDQEVSVDVRILAVPASKAVSLPIAYANLRKDLIITSSKQTLNITVRGSQSDVTAFVPDANMATVDCSSISEGGSYELPVRLNLPSNVTASLPESESRALISVVLVPAEEDEADAENGEAP